MGGLGFGDPVEGKDEFRGGLLEAPCLDGDATELLGGLLRAWRWVGSGTRAPAYGSGWSRVLGAELLRTGVDDMRPSGADLTTFICAGRARGGVIRALRTCG